MAFNNMDWTKCIVCGKAGGDLRCPLDSLQGNGQKVYSNFITTVNEFQEIDAQPVNLRVDNLAPEILIENRGKCHRSCYLKIEESVIDHVS